MTANNVSYAVYGDVMGYWNFFPTTTHWGRVPAMGWAQITESKHPALTTGERFFGWYPMADTVDIQPEPTADGFIDSGAHRSRHLPIYRTFVNTTMDPLYEQGDDGEDRQSVLRGLFLTSFLADEFLADPGGADDPYFGCDQVLVLSASSKTAIGFAQRAAARGHRVIGVTSERNREFVSDLPWYSATVTYPEIEQLDNTQPLVCVDIAGDQTLLARVHEHFDSQLKYSMLIGLSHHDAPPLSPNQGFRGPQPEFFAAPAEIERRRALWGTPEFDRSSAAALADFVEGSRQWLTIHRCLTTAEAVSSWDAIHQGTISPAVGTVVSLDDV